MYFSIKFCFKQKDFTVGKQGNSWVLTRILQGLLSNRVTDSRPGCKHWGQSGSPHLRACPGQGRPSLSLLGTSSPQAERLHRQHRLPAGTWELLGPPRRAPVIPAATLGAGEEEGRPSALGAICPGTRLPGKQACSLASEMSICKRPQKHWTTPGLRPVPPACERTHTVRSPLLGTAACLLFLRVMHTGATAFLVQVKKGWSSPPQGLAEVERRRGGESQRTARSPSAEPEGFALTQAQDSPLRRGCTAPTAPLPRVARPGTSPWHDTGSYTARREDAHTARPRGPNTGRERGRRGGG